MDTGCPGKRRYIRVYCEFINGGHMKTIRVVAAVIKAVNENNKPIIFATQRGYGEHLSVLLGFGSERI